MGQEPQARQALLSLVCANQYKPLDPPAALPSGDDAYRDCTPVRKDSKFLPEAWTRIGEFPATWAVGQHLADVAVHAWDLATATHQSTKLDPELARVALDWARAALKPELRGNTFGPEIEVPENAPIYERLAGFFGRNPF